MKNSKTKRSLVSKKRSAWATGIIETVSIMVLPSLKEIGQQIVTSINSGISSMYSYAEIFGLALLAVGIFIAFNEIFNWNKRLSDKTTQHPKIKFIPLSGIVIIIIASWLNPISGENVNTSHIQVTPNNPHSIMVSNSSNVGISINQTGGFNAGQINIINQPPIQRHITLQVIEYLDNTLSQNKRIQIFVHSMYGDPESYNFSNEIINYLEINGWQYVNGSMDVTSPPHFGLEVKNLTKYYDIWVGSNH